MTRAKKGMKPEHARYVKDQTPRDDERRRSPDGSARLFAKRGDVWQTRKDSLREFGVEFCPCCGQPVNPEMDQFTKASRATPKREMGSDKPSRAVLTVADATQRKAMINRKVNERLRKMGAFHK